LFINTVAATTAIKTNKCQAAIVATAFFGPDNCGYYLLII